MIFLVDSLDRYGIRALAVVLLFCGCGTSDSGEHRQQLDPTPAEQRPASERFPCNVTSFNGDAGCWNVKDLDACVSKQRSRSELSDFVVGSEPVFIPGGVDDPVCGFEPIKLIDFYTMIGE